MKDSTIRFWYFFWLIIISLLVVLVFSLAVIYFIAENKCFGTPSSWCYTDWLCLNEKGEEVNMSELSTVGQYSIPTLCAPLTDGTLSANGVQTINNFTSFPYIDANGNKVVGNPSQEKNIWSPDCANDASKESCPKFMLGDIYFFACRGSKDSPYYNPK